MLNIGDRFLVENSGFRSEGADCSFRTPPTSTAKHGTIIPMGASVRKRAQQGTIWPRELIIPFARAVEPCYACKIDVEHRTTGFTFTFVSAPSCGIHHEVEAICVTKNGVDLVLTEHDTLAETPVSLVGLFPVQALDVLRWFLEALSGRPHRISVSPREIRWDPPPKQERYTPLKKIAKITADEGPPTIRCPNPQPHPTPHKKRH